MVGQRVRLRLLFGSGLRDSMWLDRPAQERVKARMGLAGPSRLCVALVAMFSVQSFCQDAVVMRLIILTNVTPTVPLKKPAKYHRK